jgi:ribosomal protein S16
MTDCIVTTDSTSGTVDTYVDSVEPPNNDGAYIDSVGTYVDSVEPPKDAAHIDSVGTYVDSVEPPKDAVHIDSVGPPNVEPPNNDGVHIDTPDKYVSSSSASCWGNRCSINASDISGKSQVKVVIKVKKINK